MRRDNFEDIQEEHRKILETIESALQKLNSVTFTTRVSFGYFFSYIRN